MSISEIVAVTAVIISIGTNITLYVHLSMVMNSRFENMNNRFESVERRLEIIQGSIHELDLRLTKLNG